MLILVSSTLFLPCRKCMRRQCLKIMTGPLTPRSKPCFTICRMHSLIRLRRNPHHSVVHAIPPTASRSGDSSNTPAPYFCTSDLSCLGSVALRLFFAIGRSATLGSHFAQYTPAPLSRTHSPPQCSQYFNSTFMVLPSLL